MDSYWKMTEAMLTELWVKRVPEKLKPWPMKTWDGVRYFHVEPGLGFLRLDCHEIEIPDHESLVGIDPASHYAAVKRLDDGALVRFGVVRLGDLREIMDLLREEDLEIVQAKH